MKPHDLGLLGTFLCLLIGIFAAAPAFHLTLRWFCFLVSAAMCYAIEADLTSTQPDQPKDYNDLLYY